MEGDDALGDDSDVGLLKGGVKVVREEDLREGGRGGGL